MPVTLEQARQNATDALDVTVIDEFRTNSLMDLITFDDVVNPAGGGATLTYGYRRTAELATAGFRAINTEYTPSEISTTRHSVELKVLGGSYQLDRVLAKVGPAATGEIALQMNAKIRATQAEFGNAIINGDSAVDEDAFDGLSKALTGSTTEVAAGYDWTAGTTAEDRSFNVLETLDDFLSLLDGEPGAIVTNRLVIAKIASAARRANMYVQEVGPRSTRIASYGSIRLVDAGKKAGTNEDVIPATGGVADMYAIRFGLDGFHGVSTAGGSLVSQFAPDFTTPGAVKTGEVEMGPVAVALKKTKAAAVARGVKVA